jgi:hypothetical protein
MRYLASRLIVITVLLLNVMMPGVFFAQDSISITVTPDSGAVGASVFRVSVNGLTPDMDYTIEFVFDGVAIYASDETADADGSIMFSASSTPDDAAGVYTVQVVGDNSILATTEFELTASAQGTSDDSANDTNDTPVESVGNISIDPSTGPISTVHTISIRDLTPDTPYTVAITASETESVVYRRLWSSNEFGTIDIEIFAEDGDTTGQQIVSVFDNNGELVAQGEFMIEPEPKRNASIDVTSQTAREFTITVSGLAQFDRVSAQITASNNMLIDTILARASSEGIATLSFLASDELESGTYTIAVFADGEPVATSELSIGDASPEVAEQTSTDAPETAPSESSSITVANLTIEPESGTRGTTHIITATDLQAEQPITFTILNTDGDIEYSVTRTADETGAFTINIASVEDDELGTYPIEITDATSGEVIAQGTLEITDAQGTTTDETAPDDDTQGDTTDDISTGEIMVSPVAGDVGATHTITLSGMPANSRVGVTIRNASDDTVASSRVISTDADGNSTFEFTSRDLDKPGAYTIVAQVGLDQIAGADLTINGAVATIDPQAGVNGTSHTITITGLDADETVGFNVVFDGETLYTTDKTADAEGVATLTLATEDTDPVGDYTISVTRDAGYEPSVILTVLEAEPTASDESDNTDETDTETDSTSTPDVTDVMVFEDVIPSGNKATITFSSEGNTYVVISVESDEFDVAATIYDADRNELGYNDDANGTLNAQIGPILLADAGTYTLEVFASSYVDANVAGKPFTATITPSDIRPAALNDTQAFSLSPDVPEQYYAVDLSAGDQISLFTDTDNTLDTVLRVLNSNGDEVASDDDGGRGLDAEINNLMIEYNDTYMIVVSTFASNASGEGILAIAHDQVQSLNDGTASITLNDKRYHDLVVFDGTAGDVVMLTIDTQDGHAEDISITATVSGTEAMSYSTMHLPDSLSLPIVVPADGQVIVTLEQHSSGNHVTFDVSVTPSE